MLTRDHLDAEPSKGRFGEETLSGTKHGFVHWRYCAVLLLDR